MNLRERKVSKSMDEELTIWKPHNGAQVYGKSRKKAGLKNIGVNKFVRQNPEMALRLLLVVFVVALFAGCNITRYRIEKRLNEQHQQELAAVSFRVEQETINRMKEEYGINAANAEKTVMEEEAKVVAKVLYAMRDNREAGLHLACWSIFNRADHLRYKDSVYDVSSADQAYMGWSDANPVLDSLYNIALEEVQRWHRGVRPLDTAYVYLYWTPNEIYLFDDYGHKFYESDWMKYMDSVAN
mgnify:CR=1 FL=1